MVESMISIDQAIFLACDIQDAMIRKIVKGKTVLHNAVRLSKVAKILGVPVIMSR